ncbi:MAG: flavodoxin domain-containing protein [Anaerolineaceae bacterium]
MKKKILVTYATNAGSTADVAELVKTALANKQLDVELRPLGEVLSVEAYDAVVVGAPMLLGWQRSAKKFIHEHQDELAKKPVAFFLTAMSLIENRKTQVDGVSIQVDPGLAKPPRNPKRLSFKELYALPLNYVRPILKAAPRVKPLAIGLFGGYLNLFTLSWPARLFVLLVIQAKPGDLRDESFIKNWAINVRTQFIKSWLK